MNAMRKSTWMIMILSAAAGCAGEGDNAAGPAGGPTATGKVSKPPELSIPPAPPIPTKKTEGAPAVEGPKAENSKANPGAAKLTSEEIAAIKKLPEAEQAQATQQVVCPVSTSHLGAMGPPIKVTAEGRTVYLCCDGCEDEFKRDPKAYFAKLDKK